MNVLVQIIVVAVVVLLLVRSLAFRRARSVSPALVPWEDLLNESIWGVSTVDMDELRELFRPQAYVGLGSEAFALATDARPEEAAWSVAVREMLRERAQRAPGQVERMEKNIERFENLGRHAIFFRLGEDDLGQEVVRRAIGCKLLLRPIKRRIWIYNRMPLFMWRIMGSKMAHTCVYGGAQLVHEYEGLANAVLVFVRAHGEDYQYEAMLSAL